jgi:hypothetical protein
MFGRKKRGVDAKRSAGAQRPIPDDDVAGSALLEAFGAAGFSARFLDPVRVGVRLADGSDAVTDVSRYRADVEGAPPQEVATKAAEFVRLSAQPLEDSGTPGQHRNDLRLRLYPQEMLVEPLRTGVVTRELAPGLWETVAIDRPDSVQPLPRDGGSDEAALFRLAVENTVGQPFTTTWFDVGDARVLHIGGEHPYMAGHVHVLDRYLDAPLADGAFVSFPLPEVVLAHPIGGVHPIMGLAQLQELTGQLVDSGDKAISKQVFWWVPSGARPDLRPVHVAFDDGRITLTGDDGFERLTERYATGQGRGAP